METRKSFKNNVSCYELFIYTRLESYIQQKCKVFQGGQIKEKFENWQKLTDDTEILETVKGATFKFEALPQQTFTRPSQKIFQLKKKNLFKLKLIN